jgi:hypothetical protein
MPLRAITSGGEAGDGFAVQADRAPTRLEKAHDRRHAGALAGAVASKQAEQPDPAASENETPCSTWLSP